MVLRSDAANPNQKLEHASVREIEDGIELSVGIRLKQRQTAILIEAAGSARQAPRVDRALLRAVCLARAWAGLLASGEVASVRDLAHRYGFCNHYTAKLLPLAWLAPDLTMAILDGGQPNVADARRTRQTSDSDGLERTTSAVCDLRLSGRPTELRTRADRHHGPCYLTKVAPVMRLLSPCSEPVF